MISIFVESGNARGEHRVNPQWTIQTLKDRLESITGYNADYMELRVKKQPLQIEQSVTLNDAGFYSGMLLEVMNKNPYAKSNEFIDVSQVEKFEISSDDYEKRQDSVRNFMKLNKMGKFADKSEISPTDYSELTSKMKVGDRCRVQIQDDGLSKIGTIRFIGLVDGKQGQWIGVEYDEPYGKHNGSVNGKQYFMAKNNHGSFVRPDKVEVGDFVEEDPFQTDDELVEM